MIGRIISVSLLATMLTAFFERAALAAPDNFAPEYRRAVDAKNRQPVQPQQYQQVLKQCEDMLAKYKEPAQVRDVRLLRDECLLAMKKYDEALADLAKLQTELADDKSAQVGALMLTADVLRAQGKPAVAVATYQKLAKDYPDYSDKAAEALLRAGETLCTDQKKFAEGLAIFADVEKQFATQMPLAADAARRAAVICESVANDLPKAAALYESLADKYGSVHEERTRATYWSKSIDCLVKDNKQTEALATAAKAEKTLETSALKAGFALKASELLAGLKKMPQARAECERVICTYPLDAEVCQAAQMRLVDIFRSDNKFDDALGTARILYDAAATDAQIRTAALVVSQALRSVDGNLGRANDFLAYQRFGQAGPDGKTGTPDDLAVNPLSAVKYPAADSARDERFKAAVAARGETYEGCRAKGYLHVYWGKPKEAVQNFRLAFKCCPEPDVAAAATELVLVGMKAYTASFAGLDRVFEFINYGPKGKSGKETLPDPFAGL